MNRPIRHLLPLLSAALLPVASVQAQDDAPKPLKALLVTGGCCHDYEQQKELLPTGLSARANVEFTVVHEGEDREHRVSIYEKADWADGYDVVVHNECFGFVKDTEFVENIARPHAEGVPAVILHCSVHSYRHTETDAWREVTGMKSMKHEDRRDLKVEKLETDHPTMIGFPQEWITTNDELYIILKQWPNVVPLAKAYGAESKREYPVIWVNTVGKGRVFVTTLGHGNQTIADPVFLDLVARGLLWATGHLNDDGTPAEGYGPVGG